MAQAFDGFATLEAAEQAAKDKAAGVPGAAVKPLGTAGYMVVLECEGNPDDLITSFEVLAQYRLRRGGNGNGNGRIKRGG